MKKQKYEKQLIKLWQKVHMVFLLVGVPFLRVDTGESV